MRKLTLAAIFLVASIQLNGQAFTADSVALVAFYNSMNGAGWTNKTNWLTGQLNTWFGVTLNGSGHVRGLALPGNQVRGTMPASFLDLDSLQTLNLSNNTFGLNLPANLNELTSLTTLLLNNSGQTSLPSMVGLVNLTTLNVTSNALTFEDLELIVSIPGVVFNPQSVFGIGNSANIVVGNPWSAQAIAGGSANEYQWYRAGVPVGGATTNTISIPAVSAGDAGTYQLRVTSPLVPGITLNSSGNILTVLSPGAQTYFTWPSADGIINDTPSDSYGGFWADIDNDGDDDLAIGNLSAGAANGRSVDLYENNGSTFTRLLSAGMPTTDSPRNISWVDFDNDGDLDFYVGDLGFNISDAKGAFYRNEGNKTFTRIDLDRLADGGMWADYDKDGLVDLFIVDSGQPTVVYRNQGNGTFVLSPVSFGLGSDWTLAFADIDNDRDLDFVQIGKTPNTGFNNLQLNDSAGFYSYQSSSIISTDNLFSARGGSWADIDNDGDMDFFGMNSSTGGTVESSFYLNDGTGNFTKQLASVVLGVDVRGRSAAFGDLDNDGDMDFAVHNGKAGNTGLIIFLNNGSGAFAQVPPVSQSFIPIGGNPVLAQMSLGDANSDGFLDIFSATFSTSQPAAVYRNVGNSNHWIKFRLLGSVSNRSGVGARVEIYAGGSRQIREVTTQTGLAAQNSLVQHFGTAGATQIDSVKVYWPSGLTRILTNVASDQLLTITEIAPPPPINPADSLALVNLYSATNGAAWTNKTNWLTGDVRTWYGIVVSGDRVTEINLSANGLSGSLPNLSGLTALTRLNIPNNLVAGAIPSTLDSLTSLEYLNLYGNRFTGTIPSLPSLTGLKFLSTGANTFLALQPFPSFVFGLTQLEYLHMDNSRLQNAFPAGISALTNLKELNLSSNQLTYTAAILDEIGTLTGLQKLIFNNTNGSGAVPNSWAQLSQLTELNIASCGFNQLPPVGSWATSPAMSFVISNNNLDFGDLEPYVGFSNGVITNTGQKTFSLFQVAVGASKLLTGDPFVLAPTVPGTQNSYQWYHNNSAIGGATNLSLDLGPVSQDEAGTYRLQVTNALVAGITLVSQDLVLTVVNPVESLFNMVTGSPVINDFQASSHGGYWADFDSDGDEDLFIGNNFSTIPNFLYENLGGGNFQKVTAGDIVTIPDGSRYVNWGDYDNDGYPDVFVAEYATTGADDNVSSLYHNNGDKTFTRIPFNHKGDGGLWADYDNDGDLDLSVSTTVSAPNNINKLYRNQGNGTFDVLDSWVPTVGTWFAGWVDIDNDGDLDYNITPTTPINQIKIFRNAAGTFTEENLTVPTGTFSHRGSSWGDIDGDGDMDLFAMNAAPGASNVSQFYINDGTGQFTMVSADTRLGVPGYGGRGSAFGDADNDGDLDLFIVHRPSLASPDVIPQLFLNDGSGSFTAVPTTTQSFGFSDFATGISLADYDNDGYLDLVIGSFDAAKPNYLYHNAQSGNHYLELRLRGVASNRSAIGARVDLFVGSNRITRQVMPVSGLSGQSSLVVHAGLGSALQADSVTIYWPSGIIQKLNNVAADQVLTVVEQEPIFAPTVNSSAFVFTTVTTDSLKVSFTPGNGQARIAVLRPWTAVTFTPQDTVIYSPGQDLGNGQRVVYVGSGNQIALGGLQPDTQYHLAIFEFNGAAGLERYLVPAADTVQATLPAMMWGSFGSGPGQFNQAWDIAIAPNGHVLVADYSNHRIQKFTAGGGFLWEAPAVYPYGIAVDNQGKTYAANASAYRINVYDSLGNLIREVGDGSNGRSIFDIAVAPDGNIYALVFAWPSFQLEKFDIQGNSTVLAPLTGNYRRIDIDDFANLYLSQDPIVRKFSIDGTWIADFALGGALAVDASAFGYLYAGNNSVHELRNDGSLLHTYPTTQVYGLSSNYLGTRLYYVDLTGVRQIDITKQDQVIDFDSVGTIPFSITPYNLLASSSSGNSVQFSLDSTQLLSVAGNQLSFHGLGTAPITATVIGTHQFKPATVTQFITVVKGDQTITFNALPAREMGDLPFYLEATASSGRPITYSSTNPAVARVEGDRVTLIGPGSATITASQPGDAYFNAAASVTQNISVAPQGTRVFGLTTAGGTGNLGTVYSMKPDGSNFQALYNFGQMGQYPEGVFEMGSDGFIYGSTQYSAAGVQNGTLFKFKPDMSEYYHLKEFGGMDGVIPQSIAVSKNDGYIYGNTFQGGANNLGTLYKIRKDGTGFTKLHDHTVNGSGKIMLASDGAIYGVTQYGGANNLGTMYRINTDGSGFTVLHDFASMDGTLPFGPLTEIAPGIFAGAGHQGGQYGYGTIFTVNSDGSGYKVIHHLSYSDGLYPTARLYYHAPYLYGGSTGGGPVGNEGALFRIKTDGTDFSVIHDFDNNDGSYFYGDLTEGKDGRLYGGTFYGGNLSVAGGGGGTLFGLDKDGGNFQILKTLDAIDGYRVKRAPLVLPDSSLLFFTYYNDTHGGGSIVKVNTNGSGFQKLADLGSARFGKNPEGILTSLPNGNLVGVSRYGGTLNNGLIFSLKNDGSSLKVLHDFTDTSQPSKGVLLASDGRLYGSTSSNSSVGGIVYGMDADGSNYAPLATLEVLALQGYGDAPSPLIELPSGELVGATFYGGANSSGSLFRVNKNGSGYQKFFDFTQDIGAYPAGLLHASDGKLYIACFQGGDLTGYIGGFGSIVRMNTDGTNPTEIFDFTETGNTIGKLPYWGLTEGQDGLLYGTASFHNGNNASGLVFSINKNGSNYTILKQFSPTEGYTPNHGVVQATDGSLYGATTGGGANLGGLLYKVNTDGSNYSVLKDLDGNSGIQPTYGQLLFFNPNRQAQTIAFTLPATVSFGTTPIVMGGTATSGMPIQYVSSDPTVARVDGNILTFLKVGSATITASQAGNYEFYPAVPVQQTVTVSKADQVITFNPLPQKKLGQNDFTLEGYSSAHLWLNYISSDTSVAVIEGHALRLIGPGTAMITASQAGNAYFNPAAPVQQSITLVEPPIGQERLFVNLETSGDGNGSVLALNTDGTEINSVSFRSTDGTNPQSELVQFDGAFYGTTLQGGDYGYGTIFRLGVDGSYDKVHDFDFTNGSNPAGIMLASDGYFYGTSSNGGVGSGVVFKIRPDGTGFERILAFGPTHGLGNIQSRLLEGTDGLLYGTAATGGANEVGAIYRVAKDGSGFQIIHNFSGSSGSYPFAGLVQGADGMLYGSGRGTGFSDYSTIFSIAPDGSNYTIIAYLSGTTGRNIESELLIGQDGALYGLCSDAGSYSFGTLVKVNKDGSGLMKLHDFGNGSQEGRYPRGRIFQSTDGTLYGTTVLGGVEESSGTIFRISPDGSGYSKIHDFLMASGARGQSGVVFGLTGDLYGTAYTAGEFGGGAIYKVSTNGSNYTVLKAFKVSGNGQPMGNIAQSLDRSLFGVTYSGGHENRGTIFKLNRYGTNLTKVFDFSTLNGMHPTFGMTAASDGKLYGATWQGGASSRGVAYRFDPETNAYSKIIDFSDLIGAYPVNRPIEGLNGRLIGPLAQGGPNGSVYSMDKNGGDFTRLVDFNGGNGANPNGKLINDALGHLYGTTTGGVGAYTNGSIYRMDQDGTNFITLHQFDGTNGSRPFEGLTLGMDGMLYGTAHDGGANGNGVIFRISTNGSGFTTIHHFEPANGGYPYNGVSQGADGTLYGCTTSGGANNLGTVYRINPDGSDFQKLLDLSNQIGYQARGPIFIWTTPNPIPTTPATGITFSSVFSTQMTVSFTPGNGARHLVVVRPLSAVDWTPTDGITYSANANFAASTDLGNGNKVVSADSASQVQITGLNPGTLYFVTVYEYNGTGNQTRYLTAGAPSASRATLALPNVYVTTPANGAVNLNVTLNVTSRALTGATTYTLQLSTVPDFSSGIIERSGSRTQSFSGLLFDTLYYTRVKTNLSPDYGQVTTFSTAPPEFFSYVTSPANNATGVTLTNLSRSVTANTVIGAILYTIELNTSMTFDGISQVKVGTRTQTFAGLSPGTTYYNRVKTNLSPNWGETRQFTTASAVALTYVTSPANNAVNVSYQPSVTVTDVGATSYTVQLSPDPNFDLDVIEQTSATRTMSFTGLLYNTLYYSRAKTELDPAWGLVRSFTTTSPLAYSYMTSPANNAVNVNYVVNISSLTVPGATTYTIEANTQPGFDGVSVVRSGGRTLNFTLAQNQTYYVRVSTDLLPGQWGVARSFTTTSSLAYSYITSPANGAINVPYTTNITAFNVPLATSYIIEANTQSDFMGTSIVKMGTGRTYSFTLAHDQLYHVRVQTNLAPGLWGQTRSFTTGNPQSLAYVTSPANGVVGVPTTVNVTSNTVPGATSYTIEVNPDESFASEGVVLSGAGRTKNFAGLDEATTYYTRVSTNLSPGLWGPTRSFTTVNPFARQAGEAWVASDDEDPIVPDEITEVRVFPNPFADQVEVQVQTTDQQHLEAQLLDMTGRAVFTSQHWTTNRLHVIRGDFSPGVYLLNLRTNGANKVVRVIRK